MTNIIKVAVSGASLAVVLCAAAWAGGEKATELKSIDRHSLRGGMAEFVSVIRDRETGCEYLAWEAGNTSGGSITPRLTADGKQLCRP